MSADAGQKRVSVALKAQFYWGQNEEHGLGLVTAFIPGTAFVHASSQPPLGVWLRMKLPNLDKSGSVEFRGVVVPLEGAKLQGFGVRIAEFIRGEAALSELLGFPRGTMISADLVKPAALDAVGSGAKDSREAMVRIGLMRAEEPGFLVDCEEDGLFMRTLPAVQDGWHLRQAVRLELSIPLEQGVSVVPLNGRIMRIDPPNLKTTSDPSCGLAIQFKDGMTLAPEIVRKLQTLLPRMLGPDGVSEAPWRDGNAESTHRNIGSGKAGQEKQRYWNFKTIGLALVFIGFWVALGWFLVEWRLNSLLGPLPDPSTLPKPP